MVLKYTNAVLEGNIFTLLYSKGAQEYNIGALSKCGNSSKQPLHFIKALILKRLMLKIQLFKRKRKEKISSLRK